MKVIVEKETFITLILNEVEADWLRNICQNSMFIDNPDEEDTFDKQMRREFWNALKEK